MSFEIIYIYYTHECDALWTKKHEKWWKYIPQSRYSVKNVEKFLIQKWKEEKLKEFNVVNARNSFTSSMSSVREWESERDEEEGITNRKNDKLTEVD